MPHSSFAWKSGCSRVSKTLWYDGSLRTSFTLRLKDMASDTLYEQAIIS